MGRKPHNQRHIFRGEVNRFENPEDICNARQGGAIAENSLALVVSVKEPQLVVVGPITTYRSDVEVLTIVWYCLCVLSTPHRFSYGKIGNGFQDIAFPPPVCPTDQDTVGIELQAQFSKIAKWL